MWVAWATDGTKLLVKSICETAPKSLFRDLNCIPGRIWVRAMIGLLKNELSICQSTWRENRNAFLVIPLGDQNKDIGAASQTLLTRIRLWLWRRLSGGYFLLPEIIARLTFLINHPMSNKLRRWKPRKVWHLVRYYPTVIKKTCRVLSTNAVSAEHRDVTNSLHTLLGKYLPANQSRHTRSVIL